jgi:hypothetical protein
MKNARAKKQNNDFSKRGITGMKAGESNNQYFDMKKLSEYSSLSINTLRNYLRDVDDPIPSFRLERKLLFRKIEFDLWMEKRRTDTKKLDTIVDEVVCEVIKRKN